VPRSGPNPLGGIIAALALAVVIASVIAEYVPAGSPKGIPQWEKDLSALPGVVDYTTGDTDWLTSDHRTGSVSYPVAPTVGGDHNIAWQNCTGDVYAAPIAEEHAAHSLEHGAVWITYRPDLPAKHIEQLTRHVRGANYTMMSPYPAQVAPISLQAWGFQLPVESPEDDRITTFLALARVNAGPEPGAACSGGITTTGAIPVTKP